MGFPYGVRGFQRHIGGGGARGHRAHLRAGLTSSVSLDGVLHGQLWRTSAKVAHTIQRPSDYHAFHLGSRHVGSLVRRETTGWAFRPRASVCNGGILSGRSLSSCLFAGPNHGTHAWSGWDFNVHGCCLCQRGGGRIAARGLSGSLQISGQTRDPLLHSSDKVGYHLDVPSQAKAGTKGFQGTVEL